MKRSQVRLKIQQVGVEENIATMITFFAISVFTVVSLAGTELYGSQINDGNGNSSSNVV